MNEREKRFCEEYLVDLCAKRAALRAGYAPSTAHSSASRWIQPEHPSRPALRAEIDRMLAERALRTRVNADRVVLELADIAFAGEPPDAEDDSPGAAGRAAGKGVRTQDRLRALELLGKHLGMFAGELRAEQVRPVIVDDVQGEPPSEEGS